MAAAAPESRAEAAFRELLALHHAPSRLPSIGQRAAASRRSSARDTAAIVQEEVTSQPTLAQLLQVLRDGGSTAGARKSALAALRAWVEERQDHETEGEGQQRAFQEHFPAVLKCVADPSEGCREQALHVLLAFIRRGMDVAPCLPRLFAALTMRLPAGLQHDPDAGLFIYDAAAHDAHQRGKAISRQDKSHQCVGPDASTEPSEAVRLLSLRVVHALLNASVSTGTDTDNAGGALQAHFHDAILFVQHHLRDASPEVRIAACQLLADAAQAPAYELGMKAYGLALVRALLPSLRHPLARVRAAALGTLGAVAAVPDRAKCRSVGAAAMEELVGFRPDNVLSVASFYRPEVDVNYVAELVRDPQASVRLRLLEVLEGWLLRLPDRRAHDARLVPYLLTLLDDPIQRVQERAFAAIVACGEQFLAEERARREAQQQQHAPGIDELVEAELESSSPWPSIEGSSSLFPPLAAARPPLGARVYVRSATRRALPVVAEELVHWTPATRLRSARLLRLLVLFHEGAVLAHLHLLVPALVQALQVEAEAGQTPREGGGGGAAPILLDCAAWLGWFMRGTGENGFLEVVDGLLRQQEGESSAARRRAVAAVRAALGLGPGKE